MTQLSENAKTVLNYLKENYGKEVLYTKIAEDTGLAPKTVNALITHALVKRGLAARTPVEVTEGDKTVSKNAIVITAEGLSFDPDAVVETEADA